MKINKYSFIVLFALVFVCAIPFVVSSYAKKNERNIGFDAEESFSSAPTQSPDASFTPEPAATVNTDENATAEVQTHTPSAADSVFATSTPPRSPIPTPVPIGDKPYFAPEKGSFVTVDRTYFDDALFVGDSRSTMMCNCGTLKNADYFACVGMSVYNISKKASTVSRSAGQLFADFITKKQYGKVYVMLGFNECGYAKSNTVKKYAELLCKIKAAQPNAKIFIEANLLVTAECSKTDKYSHNPDIIQLNNMFSELADGVNTFYIDPNPIFADANGYLDPMYTGDGTHPYAKYYPVWCDWLMTRGISDVTPSPIPTPSPTPSTDTAEENAGGEATAEAEQTAIAE